MSFIIGKQNRFNVLQKSKTLLKVNEDTDYDYWIMMIRLMKIQIMIFFTCIHEYCLEMG